MSVISILMILILPLNMTSIGRTIIMISLISHIEQMDCMWYNEVENATKKGDTINITYCKAKYDTYHSLLLDIKNGRFFKEITS